jgi:DNA-binding transcriptional regulator YiaG
MEDRQRHSSPSKKALKLREKPSRSVEAKDKKGLSTEIRTIRKRLEITQLQLASKLGVSRGRVAAWEAGEKPPLQIIGQLASLALPEAVNRFVEYAGFDPKILEEQFWALFLKGQEGAGDVGAVNISLVEFGAQTRTVIRHGARRATFSLPRTRVPFPEKTVCMLLTEEFPGRAWSAGDLLVIDTSRTDPQHLLGCLVAAYFPAAALNLRQLYGETPVEHGRVVSQKQLETLARLNKWEDDPAMSESELTAKHGPKPGVRLGWLRIEYRRGYDLPGEPWRLVLEQPVIAGLSQSWEDRKPFDLSDWSSDEFPRGKPLLPFVRGEVRIEGRVIGWLSRQQSPRAKPVDLQEPK